jgi:hypothetical protein
MPSLWWMLRRQDGDKKSNAIAMNWPQSLFAQEKFGPIFSIIYSDVMIQLLLATRSNFKPLLRPFNEKSFYIAFISCFPARNLDGINRLIQFGNHRQSSLIYLRANLI